MKETLYLVFLIILAIPELNAQTVASKSSVQLKEVVVRGARVIQRTDRKWIFPSEEMIKSATSGYNFLMMLPLPNVKVDDVNESIVALIPLSAPCWCVSTVWWLRRTTSGRYAPRRWRRSSL